MTNILLAVIFVWVALFSVLTVIVGLRLWRSFASFVSPESEGKPSPFALWLDSITMMFARAITAQFKATFMGRQSGDSRAEQAVMGDITEDALNASSPLAGSLMQSFPTLRKSLRRNPALAALAQAALSKLTGGLTSGNGSSSSSQPKFKL